MEMAAEVRVILLKQRTHTNREQMLFIKHRLAWLGHQMSQLHKTTAILVPGNLLRIIE